MDLEKLDNPLLSLSIPAEFPAMNSAVYANFPTKYGVQLGEKLFHDKRLSGNNTISCASCHQQAHAFTDQQAQAIGIENRVGLRNTPPIQNMAFLQFYNWDGNILQLENQALVPIITHEEMNSSIVEVMEKLKDDDSYKQLLTYSFGDGNFSPDRIYKSLAQYAYSLISANSKYDSVMRMEHPVEFSTQEARGFAIFKLKCASCHRGALFTDQSFRTIGFPINSHSSEAGRARVTGKASDQYSFRVPSLRNVAYTAPYGSFGQFANLMDLLNYLDAGVLESENLDPYLKNNNNRIPMSALEKEDIIAFLKTLSDPNFIKK
ncbi:cytochrome-c peroxidase [Sphingobacterium sp. HJSM2_6]|uniref:cytochrome-c peroxidase n=1 Tax=Sphingobacterium sp. HJSM2_6 TaxID=3366264 RepID=UPI003BDDB796